MRQHGVRRVVYASSAAIYGNNGEGVAIDETTAKAPLTPYAADKLAGEHYLISIAVSMRWNRRCSVSSMSSGHARIHPRRTRG